MTDMAQSSASQATVNEPAECTCNNCIDGWLSPRMKERLGGEADFLRFVSNSILEDLTELGEDELIPDWCIVADTSLHYIPMDFQQKMTLAFYKAYIQIVEAILRVMINDTDDASCIPTVDTITAQLGLSNTAAQSYFDSGGEVIFALEALVDRAYEKSPEGPEYRRKPALQEEEVEFENETEELPRCVHDLDFTRVRTKLGLPPEGKGPHWFFLTDDEDSDEDDDEEDVYVGQQSESVARAPVR